MSKELLVSHNFRELMRKVEEKHKEGYVILVDNATKNTGMRFYVTMVKDGVLNMSPDTVVDATQGDHVASATSLPETPKEAVVENTAPIKDTPQKPTTTSKRPPPTKPQK